MKKKWIVGFMMVLCLTTCSACSLPFELPFDVPFLNTSDAVSISGQEEVKVATVEQTADDMVAIRVLEETDVTWIYVYDSTGKELLKFHTTMKNTGYPVSVSLSKDALLCAVSYLYVDAGSLKSTVAFYNFDEYGTSGK